MTKFEEFFGNVRDKHTESMRNDIMTECGISAQSFRNWRKGKFKPDVQWWSKINSIAEKYGYPKPYTL
jgi:hypothetical protein